MAKRRSFSPEFKVQVVLGLLSGTNSNAQICREHQLSPAVVSAWKEQFLDRAPEIFSSSRSKSMEQERIADLERLAGRLALELEMAKKASSFLTSRSSGSDR